MGIIYKLTLRYLKKNKKRTRATILGIACTMIILTTISLFTNTLMGMIRESIREDQGSWHLIFHDLDQEQYESLKENKKLCNVSETECEDCEPDAGLCVAAEMKNVSWRMFARTQKNTLQNLLQSTFFILLNFSEGFYRLEDLRILYTIAYIPLIGE